MAEPTLGNPGQHSSDTGGSVFLGASGVNIHGGTFNAYGASGADDKKKKIAEAIDLLSSRAERGAPYDAAAREDEPKCHEQTRVAIINGIGIWTHSRTPNARPLMWMYGPAGSGKTTIMQTVAGTFDEDGSLAASFFFSRLSAERPRQKENFVITLAHQLSLCVPAMQEPLAEALSDKSILTKSLDKQLDALVIGPFNSLDHAQIGSRCVFLVDGLDECSGDTAQRDILGLLDRFVHQVRHRTRILVASRTLSHIQAFFSRQTIGELTQTTPLDNDYQSDEDVTTFLISAFKKIRDEHPSCGRLPSEWPRHSDVNVLVKRASGQFIYASVVVQFIADHGRHPDESLQIILGLKVSGDAKPYEQLDAVYTQVLSTVEPQNVEFVQTLFGCLVLNKHKFYIAHVARESVDTINCLDSFFMMEPGTTQARINRVSPLIQPTKKSHFSSNTAPQGLQFSHASFPDYVFDHSRSNKHFLNLRKVHCTLARHWFKLFPANSKLHPRGAIDQSQILFFHSLPQYEQFGELVDVTLHCMAAEWTFELRQDVLTFNLEAALTASPEMIAAHGQHLQWDGIFFWLCFIFWIKENCLLSSAETDCILDRIHALIQSVLSELSIPPTLIRVVATALTMRKCVSVSGAWFNANHAFGQSSEWAHFALFDNNRSHIFRNRICDTSCLWLCNSLVGNMAVSMDCLFFADGCLYAEFALIYAQFQCIGEQRVGNSRWVDELPVILSKAAPSKELATLLMQKFLQVPSTHFVGERGGFKMLDFYRAICIYLFECGIPFRSKHQHSAYYDPHDKHCGICFIFDPFKKECANIELSIEPTAQPAVEPMQIAEEEVHEPLHINPLREGIFGLPLFWIQAWVVWLADAVIRFFPVVA